MEKITLGSGLLYVAEYTSSTTIPDVTAICVESNLLGLIQGGAELEYKPTFYEAKDDFGKVVKNILTEEEATFKTGIITWFGDTLKKLCATGRVTETPASGSGASAVSAKRTVKIGGIGNDDGKSYVLCFHHEDETDGDCWLLMRGKNQAGFTLAFAQDKETVIDAEYKCLPLDSEGTLITYIEEDPSITSQTE